MQAINRKMATYTKNHKAFFVLHFSSLTLAANNPIKKLIPNRINMAYMKFCIGASNVMIAPTAYTTTVLTSSITISILI
jgi:hypothetical protein